MAATEEEHQNSTVARVARRTKKHKRQQTHVETSVGRHVEKLMSQEQH
jgi:hypothetical protein